MSDRDDTINIDSERGLAAALRALPLAAPPADLWPELMVARLRKKHLHRWRYALPATLAAAVALAVLGSRAPLEKHVPFPTAATTVAPSPTTAQRSNPQPAADSGELDTLHERSQSLERWIATISANAPQDGRDLMAAVEVEDLIGLVDVQLGATRGDDDALPLWRQRVALLEDLATIRGNAFAVASNDAGAVRASSNLLN